MNHRKGNKKLGRPTDQRLAIIRGLVRSLFLNNRIVTTDVRAHEAKKVAEKIITLGKQNTLHSRRRALKIIQDKSVIRDVFNIIASQYKDRQGGYTRITKVGIRRGDAATMAQLELIG